MISDTATLKEARDWLRAKVEGGERCPCCTQMAKVYRRKVNSQMARTLITLYRAAGYSNFVHAPSLPGDTHECSQLAWWDLIEEEPVVRPDGGRAGFWRVTRKGGSFINQGITIPKYAVIYDSRVLGFDGVQVDIQQCLGSRFNLQELMSA